MSKKMVELITVANESIAKFMGSLLEQEGLTCAVLPSAHGATGVFVHSRHFVATYVISVPSSEYAMARAVIEQAQEDSIDIDWDQIDVGEPEDETAREIAEKDTTDG